MVSNAEVISSFSDEWRFLSNFYQSAMSIRDPDGNLIEVNSVESAFQAHKTSDPREFNQIAQMSPRNAKRAGRKVQLIAGWGTIKYDIMLGILRVKFRHGAPLSKRLVNQTGDARLVEVNTWHDNIWGDCTCGRAACTRPGQNRLGLLLQQVRSELRCTPYY